jgi:hypothetical protein
MKIELLDTGEIIASKSEAARLFGVCKRAVDFALERGTRCGGHKIKIAEPKQEETDDNTEL